MATEKSESEAYQCSSCGFLCTDLQLLLHHSCFNGAATGNDLSIATTSSVEAELAAYTSSHTETAAEHTSCSDLPESSLLKWDDRHVRLLIAAYKHHKHLFNNGKLTKKQIFERIAKYFNETADVTVTGEQCLRKWRGLEQKLKEVEDNNKRTGRARKDWKFLDEMTDCLGQSPKVNPAFTFDVSLEAHASRSASPSTTSSTDNGNGSDLSDNDGDEKRTELKPRRQRKRKSYSSAAEMLTFLQTYTDKREKAEEEKVNLLREMKDERKQFFNQFLDILKNK